jgi:hypothetical protein
VTENIVLTGSTRWDARGNKESTVAVTLRAEYGP